MSHLFTRNSSGPCGFTVAFARLKNAKKIACYTVYIFNRARLKRLGGTPLPLSFRGGASHGTLVSLHLPLLGFFFIFFVCVFLCVCVCVCVCVCCIINLFCISQEEHPIKLWKKKFPRGFSQHVIENR